MCLTLCPVPPDTAGLGHPTSALFVHSCHSTAAQLLTCWKPGDSLVRWSLHSICVEGGDIKSQPFAVIIQPFHAAFARVWDLGAVGPSLFQAGWRVSLEQLDLAPAAFHPKVLLNVCGPLIFLSAR